MFGKYKTWRPARDAIDFTIKNESIFNREARGKKPLAPNTMRRIVAGLQKFGGRAFVIGQQSGAAPRDIDQPLPTVAGAGAISVIEPFIEPFLVPFHSENEKQKPRSHSIDKPLPTVHAGGIGFGLVEPFVVMINGTREDSLKSASRSIDDPLPTITGSPHIALVEPFIMPVNHGKNDKRSYSLNEPMPTVTSVDAWSLVEPFLVEYYGTGSATSVDEPLKTQTGRDRFGLVQPMIFKHGGKTFLLDIHFRMLQPRELARAMSFPKSYKFRGSREQVVKQIGNAVPVQMATALCKSTLSQ